jgi:hypothetical protein
MENFPNERDKKDRLGDENHATRLNFVPVFVPKSGTKLRSSP